MFFLLKDVMRGRAKKDSEPEGGLNGSRNNDKGDDSAGDGGRAGGYSSEGGRILSSWILKSRSVTSQVSLLR